MRRLFCLNLLSTCEPSVKGCRISGFISVCVLWPLDTGTNVAHTKKFLGCKCQPPCLKPMTGTLPAGATLLTCVLQASTSATNSTESPGSENVQGTVLTLLLILDTWTSFVISWLPSCGELLPSSRIACVHTPRIRLGLLMPKIHCEECARFWSPPFFFSFLPSSLSLCL